MDWYARNNIKYKQWRAVRLTILERDNYRCQLCGKAGGRMEVDHQTPLALGGDAYGPENLRALCRNCHCEITRQQNIGRNKAPERKALQDLIMQRLNDKIK